MLRTNTGLYAARIALPLGPSTHLVALDAIDLIVARGAYLDIHAIDRTCVVRRTLHGFPAGLDPACFVQLHRSAVVRVGAIRAIRPQGSGRFRPELRGERPLCSGRNFRARVQALLGTPATGSEHFAAIHTLSRQLRTVAQHGR